MRRFRTAHLLALIVIALGSCSTQEPSAPAPAPPNVVLITIDALRADSLSYSGHPQIETPNLDRLASEGIVFSQAISSFVGTTAAMPSLMTGLFPSFEGVTKWNDTTKHGFSHLNSANEAVGLTANVETLAEILAASGYQCAGFNTNPHLSPRWGFNQGFHHYDNFGSYFADRKRTSKHPLVGQYPPADVVVDHALSWISHEPQEPVFLWFHLMDPHSPYLPPPPFDRLPHRVYTPATDLQINEALYCIVNAQVGVAPPEGYTAVEELPSSADEALDHLKALYEGEIRFADRELGRFFEGLQRLGVWDRTMVIVTADHGEEFYDHGHMIHHLLEPALEELIRIPLAIRLPRAEQEERRVDTVVRMVDIAPTVLDYVGAAGSGSEMDGVSLRPLIEGCETSELTAFVSYIKFGIARSDRWKYRRVKEPFGTHLPGEFLFDIVADPLETRDLAAEQPAVLADMRQRYQAFVARLELRGEAAPGSEPQPHEVDPELEERLRALGYVE